MTGLDLLWATYDWLPAAILLDFVVLQLALRWGYRRARRARGRSDG